MTAPIKADQRSAQAALGYGDGPYDDLPDYAREEVDSVAEAITNARKLERMRLLGGLNNFASAQSAEAKAETNLDVQHGMLAVIGMIHALISVENR